MTEPEDIDTARVKSAEYWDGYYQGKATAMRNVGHIQLTWFEASRRTRRVSLGAEVGFWVFASISTGCFLWALAISTPPYWAWMMQGSTFTMVGTKLGYWMFRR